MSPEPPTAGSDAEGAAGITLATLTGDDLGAALDSLADLRIRVFRDWPYLYGGDAGYERDYLRAYADSERAVVIAASAPDGTIVGAATAAPMADHASEFAAPFAERGIDIAHLYYFGESVLLPEWRGHGTGHAFFEAREAAARSHGFATACFCAVVRPADHPLKPTDYRPLDAFWTKRGYARVEGLVASYPWADIGDGGREVAHDMQFWMRELKFAD